jgi:DNA repair protein RadC
MERKIRELPEAERPRERLFLFGDEELSDIECIALVVGSVGTRPALDVAGGLLSEFGGLRGLGRADPVELMERGKLGLAGAAALRAALQLSRRAARTPLDPSRAIRGGVDLFDRFRERASTLRKETFFAIYLDGRNRVIREERISEGTVNAAIVHPREVLGPALRTGAASFLVLHNHPSGDPSPSAEDAAVTLRLQKAGELVGIPLIDHLIIGDERYCSFLERGLMSRSEREGRSQPARHVSSTQAAS